MPGSRKAAFLHLANTLDDDDEDDLLPEILLPLNASRCDNNGIMKQFSLLNPKNHHDTSILCGPEFVAQMLFCWILNFFTLDSL
jgi:hypothetical protein